MPALTTLRPRASPGLRPESTRSAPLSPRNPGPQGKAYGTRVRRMGEAEKIETLLTEMAADPGHLLGLSLGPKITYRVSRPSTPGNCEQMHKPADRTLCSSPIRRLTRLWRHRNALFISALEQPTPITVRDVATGHGMSAALRKLTRPDSKVGRAPTRPVRSASIGRGEPLAPLLHNALPMSGSPWRSCGHGAT